MDTPQAKQLQVNSPRRQTSENLAKSNLFDEIFEGFSITNDNLSAAILIGANLKRSDLS